MQINKPEQSLTTIETNKQNLTTILELKQTTLQQLNKEGKDNNIKMSNRPTKSIYTILVEQQGEDNTLYWLIYIQKTDNLNPNP